MGRKASPPKGITAVRLDRAVESYVDRVRGQYDGSHTVTIKKSIMRNVCECLGADREVWTLTRGDMINALTWMINGADEEEAAYRRAHGMRSRTGRRSQGSQGQARAAIRQFLTHCHEQGWLDDSVQLPAKDIFRSARTGGQRIPKPKVRFAKERWPEVLEVAGQRHMRTRMAVAIGLICARRVSEAVLLQWGHIQFGGPEPSIEFTNKKGGHTLRVPLYPPMRAELELWREWAREWYGEPQDDWHLVPARTQPRDTYSRIRLKFDSALYPVDMTAQSSTESVLKDVRIVLDHFGIEKNSGAGTHTFRRSAARAIREEHGLYVARAVLDHKHVTTTELYDGSDEEQYQLMMQMMPQPDPEPPTHLPENVVPIRRKESA